MKSKLIIIILSCVIVILTGMLVFLLIPNDKDKLYTISFDTVGGEKVADIKAKKDEKVKLPTTTKDGYIFNGWKDEEGKTTDNQITVSKDLKLTADWTEEESNKVIIVFDSKGGTKVDSITINEGEELKLPPNPTREGYRFVAWKDKNEVPIGDGALLVRGTITLYAYWEIEQTTKPNIPIPENKKYEKTKDYLGYWYPKIITEDVIGDLFTGEDELHIISVTDDSLTFDFIIAGLCSGKNLKVNLNQEKLSFDKDGNTGTIVFDNNKIIFKVKNEHYDEEINRTFTTMYKESINDKFLSQ